MPSPLYMNNLKNNKLLENFLTVLITPISQANLSNLGILFCEQILVGSTFSSPTVMF